MCIQEKHKSNHGFIFFAGVDNWGRGYELYGPKGKYRNGLKRTNQASRELTVHVIKLQNRPKGGNENN